MDNKNRIIIFLIAWLMPLAMLAQTNHWTPVSAPYEDNMTLTGVIQINGVEQQSTALEIGAFCGTECRGSARPVLFPVTGRYVFSLTIFGNNGDQITFKLYDHNQGTELNLQSPAAVTFGPNGLGSPIAPYVLNFTAINYTISASASPTAGGTVSGAGTYQNGSTCTLTATPNTGYTFMYWTKNGSIVSYSANYSFTVTSSGTYVANFSQNSYTISASASPTAGGNVSGAGNYNYGATCNLTATANTGYTFTNWTKNGTVVSTNASYSFTVTGSGTYVANFSLNSYTISASANPSAGGSVSGGGTYNHGSTCTLTATANTGYTFTNWTKNGTVVSTNANYSFTVTSGGTYVANFSLNSYTISASASPSAGGSVTGAGNYNYGATCNLTATANTGYTFTNWTKNGTVVSTSASYSFTVTGNGTYVANFSLNSYTISASASPSAGGSVSGAGNYNYGATCNLTATANTGYTFTNWTKNGTVVSTNASYSFTVTSSGTYVANFSQNTYTISASANPSAGGNVTGAGTYNYAATCTLTATANTGYTFTNWTENGELVSTEATYSFTVTGDRDLVANFAVSSAGTIVDLGLPSGTLWAVCNVGANAPEQVGDYFAWGETQSKDLYNWNTYQYCMGSENTMTKYCNNVDYGYNGFTDDLTILLPEDDAATVHWGTDWRMPTYEEFQELNNNTTVTWTEQNGVGGMLFTASNGNSLFLPATGYRWNDGGLHDGSCYGGYWSSSLNLNNPNDAKRYNFSSGCYYLYYYGYRLHGLPVRPVRNLPIVTVSANPADGGTVNGGGTYEEGSICTLTATANTGYTFINWTENGTVVSSEATYSFTVTGNRDLVANFYLVPVGAINGLFSVGTGQQVFFSQGNLQYIGSAGNGDDNNTGAYWRFAEHQWDYFGDNGQGGDSPTVDRDLFAWGTSGYAHGAICYQPWSNGTNRGDHYAYGGYYCSLNDNAGQADWGYNAISNGGNTTNTWRTLNKNEWRYLFYYRNTITGIRYAKAQVAGFDGVVLLPDDWNGTSYVFNNANSGGASYSSNVIDSDTWYLLEADGAVFLRATHGGGTRYWSSEICFEHTEYYDRAYALVFWDSYLSASAPDIRYTRECVRLVCPADDSSYTIEIGASPAEYGTVNGGGVYDYGTTCTLMAIANDNYAFLYWTEDGKIVSIEPNYMFRVTSNRNLEAHFDVPLSITATSNPIEGGVITGAGEYDYGSICTLMATANEGYTFMYWTENGNQVSAEATYSFTVTDHRDIVAHFALPFAITATASPTEGGSINGIGEYDYNTTCTLTATSNEGYTFLYWTENGNQISSDTEYSFTVTSDRGLVAEFISLTLPLNVTVVSSPTEGGVVAGTGEYYYGNTCTLTATPNSGYLFSYWTKNGNVVSCFSPYSFTVTEGATYEAHFEVAPEGGVCIGNPESGNQYLPSYSWYKYTLSQQIYTASEIGTVGLINSVSFYNTGGTKTRNYDIYLVHTDKTTFDSNYDWIAVTEADRVFSGDVTMVANAWTTFWFDTPFAYNGVSNLALIVDDNSGNWTGSPHMACRVFDANGNQAIRVYSDGTNYDPYNPSGYGGTLHSVKNQIRLGIIPYELTVHEGTTTNSYVPVYGLYTDAYLKSEFIMPASELTQIAGFSINRMKFYASQTNVSWGNARFQVFMKEVDDTSINSYSGFEGATVVYEGSLNISDGMMDVVFAVPYQYGGGNLLIGFYEPATGSYVSSHWYGETVDGASVQGKSFNSLEDVDCNQRNFLPKTTFYYQVPDSYQQSFALASGWNWFSTNVEITLDDLKTALVEALPGTSIVIKSKTQNTAYNPGTNQWRGSLASLDVAQMYMVSVSADCEITLAGMPINPAAHPVTISYGVNWIGFPLGENKTLTSTFTGFAVNGDVVKSKTNNASYLNGQWRGSFNTLETGQGYMYISNSVEDRVFTFPASAK